ncbi:MAG TPA: Uma2 family endonuclease [Planctomycetota bacterium]|nr:Uma2 family endonuclease [Planctomycetota bacterium]
MTTTARRPQKRWTYADYCRIPADRNRHEIIDGRHFVNPAPSPYHQLVSIRLGHQLMTLITDRGRGIVLDAPIDVHLGPGTVVQPDLVVLRPRSRCIIGDRKLTGGPDLLIEILSPSNRNYDRRTKRNRYERAGVREFWLVDPEAHLVEQLILRRGTYAAPIVCTERIRPQIFRGIEIDLRRVW